MPDTEITVARLSTLRSLRTLTACAVRRALCAGVLYRISEANVATLRQAALDSLDALLIGLPVTTAERVRVRTGVAAAADRFAHSRLGRRLLTMPVSQITASPVPSADLVVCDRSGRKYAIVFAMQPVLSAFAEITTSMTRELPDCEAVLIYNVECGFFRRFQPATQSWRLKPDIQALIAEGARRYRQAPSSRVHASMLRPAQHRLRSA